MNGRVFDIQRFSTHDGPGIRTTVFFKGCPLHCAWCHNPEGIDARSHLSWDRDRCAGCGRCVLVCQQGARRAVTEDGRVLYPPDRARCVACGECVPECAAAALELVGRSLSVAEVMGEVLADRAFYMQTSGGMTLSGGEPLAQPDFAVALLGAAKAEGLHCCVETCGLASWDTISRVLPLTDLFLYDWKLTDPEDHRRHTGQSNEIIRRNLHDLHRAGAKIRLQCPVIPGINDSEAHLEGITALAESMPGVEVNMLPYHPLGTTKLAKFGWPTPAAMPDGNTARPTVREWATRLARRGIRVVGNDGIQHSEVVQPADAIVGPITARKATR